jgi:hypothetical protein
MPRRRVLSAVLAVGASLAVCAPALAQGPPLPTAANGATVERIATGLATPPVVGLATNAGYVYVGDLTGSLYRVAAPAAG